MQHRADAGRACYRGARAGRAFVVDVEAVLVLVFLVDVDFEFVDVEVALVVLVVLFDMELVLVLVDWCERSGRSARCQMQRAPCQQLSCQSSAVKRLR